MFPLVPVCSNRWKATARKIALYGILTREFSYWIPTEEAGGSGATNHPGRPHQVVAQYDQRAAAEPLIAEAQREGVLAIPSKRFQAHHAFFQIVMLAYNLWRWMKWLASQADPSTPSGHPKPERPQMQLPDHTIRIARLKRLYVAAKIVVHGNRDEVRYSEHEQRASGLIDFLQYLDRHRAEAV